MSRRIALSVNDTPVEIDYFVQGFIDHTIGGMIEALEGTGRIKTLRISIEGNAVDISLNEATVPAKTFVSNIIRNTILGMVSSLKAVDKIDRLQIDIERTD